MLETVSATSTYIKTEAVSQPQSDPLSWDSQQFPDSNTKFSPIKQEILDPFDLNQTELIELKPIPFDYGSANLISSLDPILNNNNTIPSNNNSSSNNNNCGSLVNNNNNNSSSTKKMADLFINIKPLSPHDFGRASSDSFPFHQSPSDVTSSGSISPQAMTRIDFTTDQNAFDDLGNIVGLSVGADSTVPSLESDDVDLESLFETIKPLPLLPNSAVASSDSGFDLHSSASLTTIHASDPVICSISSSPSSSAASSSLSSSLSSTTLMMSTNNNNTSSCNNNSVSNHSLSTNAQPYIGSLSTLVKGSRMTIVEPRDSFPQNLSPILRGAITGTGSTYSHLSYPQIKFESMDMLKQEYYQQQEQMPHSTVSSLADHRRPGGLNAADNGPNGGINAGGPNTCIIRSKPKPHKIKQRALPTSSGGSPQAGGGASGVAGGGDLSKKMMHHCQICNRGFLNKSNIKVHMRTHTGEKPFGCDHCSKAFRQKAHLLKHMSIHKRISRD